MQSLPEGGGGRTYRTQSLIVTLLKKVAIFALIVIIAFILIPQFLIYVIIITLLIGLLSGEWIKNHPFVQLIVLIAIIGLILFIISTTLLMNIGIISSKEYQGMRGSVSGSWSIFKDSWKNFNPIGMWKNFQTKQVDIATGGYFAGQVEQSKDDQELGLHLERLESSGMDLMEGEEAVFWATLKGKSIGDHIISGKIGCNASDGNNNIYSLTPIKDFSIYSYEMTQYECRFRSLPGDKSVKVNFWVEYNFVTLGYTKAYFIDQERLRTLRSLNKDPLFEAGIMDRNPISIYTNGPIQLGIGTSDYQPIPVKNNNDDLFVLGITLQTKPIWKGKISRINDLEIQLHKSMHIIDPNKCDHKFEETSDEKCKQRCEQNQECIEQCGEYNFYRLQDSEKTRIKEIENYRTFKCPVQIYTRNDLLGNVPISTRFVRIITDYTFKSEIERLFYVKKAETLN